MTKKNKYLDNVNFPSDLKKFSMSQLKILAEEVRSEMIDAVSMTGGHLGAGLGVVELTVALHHIFNFLNISNFKLSLYLIVFLYPSKLIKVALPFFKSFFVFFPTFLELPL